MMLQESFENAASRNMAWIGILVTVRMPVVWERWILGTRLKMIDLQGLKVSSESVVALLLRG
ncbi:hypothetical protein S1OALGB6SA_1655 [Olavius algarvensis spirochete endosymbiont]|nr:hypothetical protein S1OALGB6SA_1655 [Olavius algarvensis spirochete endosymbiont]